MPTYEYQCTKCQKIIEVFHSITAKPKRRLPTDCQTCNNSAPVRRLIGTGGAVIFKGSGFYETDYRSDSYKKSEKAAKDAQTPKKDSDKTTKSDNKKSPTKADQTSTSKPKKTE